MSGFYANIHTDSEVIERLKEYVKRGEVEIERRRDGGLDINVTYRTAFANVNDYARVKGYLRKNGFSSRVGMATRQQVSQTIRGDDFEVKYLPSDMMFDSVINKVNANLMGHFFNE
jgi:hypothetical protein